MSAMELQFRTSAFGGFQKQDVLTYLENTGREHAERVEALQKELSGALAAMLDLGRGSGPMDHMFALKGEFTE